MASYQQCGKRVQLHTAIATQKGNRNLCNSYRSVSLTSVIVKMLETIIKDELMQYFKSENHLSTCQHGFCSSHSCVTQLLQAVNDWSLALSLVTQLTLYTWICVRLLIVCLTDDY